MCNKLRKYFACCVYSKTTVNWCDLANKRRAVCEILRPPETRVLPGPCSNCAQNPGFLGGDDGKHETVLPARLSPLRAPYSTPRHKTSAARKPTARHTLPPRLSPLRMLPPASLPPRLSPLQETSSMPRHTTAQQPQSGSPVGAAYIPHSASTTADEDYLADDEKTVSHTVPRIQRLLRKRVLEGTSSPHDDSSYCSTSPTRERPDFGDCSSSEEGHWDSKSNDSILREHAHGTNTPLVLPQLKEDLNHYVTFAESKGKTRNEALQKWIEVQTLRVAFDEADTFDELGRASHSPYPDRDPLPSEGWIQYARRVVKGSGNVDGISFDDAQTRYNDHLQRLKESTELVSVDDA